MHAQLLVRALLALGALTAATASPVSFEGLAHMPRRDSVRTWRSCNRKNAVALTFDDGPWQNENRVVNQLNNAGAKGTFFVNGNNYGCIYDHAKSLRKAFNDGHLIGSHGWEHLDFTTLNRQQINRQLHKNEVALQRILGVRPLYFRPPFGAINDLVLDVLSERGYRGVFMWDADTKDADGAGVLHGKRVCDRVVNSGRSHMVLMHETVQGTVSKTLPYALNRFNDRGFRLLTAAECNGQGSDPNQWYDFVDGREDHNDSWTC